MENVERRQHVMFLGLRGFPDVQGGVETHCENLCPELVKLGCDVTVLVRSPYQPVEVGAEWQGVKFVSLWAPKSRSLEAILHSIVGVFYAAFARPDILHIQAIGPALVTPMARLFGLKVVVTHHGPDYDRQKWGRFAKFALESGERWGVKCSNALIVISKTIERLVINKHHVVSSVIPNGVNLPLIPDSKNILDQFGLKPNQYILLVSRLVPEKRHLDLIEAFKQSNLTGWKLVIVGASDHPDEYVQKLIDIASQDTRIVMTGFQKGVALSELYGYAGFFVLPSSHEGLPIAMLEALSYGLPVIASSIPANLEVGLNSEDYFSLGDITDLRDKLIKQTEQAVTQEIKAQLRDWVKERYNWLDISKKTKQVYEDLI